MTIELREPSNACADAVLAANQPFIVPLELRIDSLVLNGVVALVVRGQTAHTRAARP